MGFRDDAPELYGKPTEMMAPLLRTQRSLSSLSFLRQPFNCMRLNSVILEPQQKTKAILCLGRNVVIEILTGIYIYLNRYAGIHSYKYIGIHPDGFIWTVTDRFMGNRPDRFIGIQPNRFKWIHNNPIQWNDEPTEFRR